MKNIPVNNEDGLIREALDGSVDSLELLLSEYQHYIYNIAFKMVLSPFDAEDITQEVLLKIITQLHSFKGESQFSTWVYRITSNHVLTMRKKWLEERYPTFHSYAYDLENIPSKELSSSEQIAMSDVIKDARMGCMAGMILCLSREQRIVYILGELLKMPHDIGAEILEISKDNYRQRLTRARKDLYSFMDKKCGLINKKNPCRCQKKTKGFIKEGWVDATTMKFNSSYTETLKERIPYKDSQLDALEYYEYEHLMLEQPFQEKEHITKLLSSLLKSKTLNDVFDLGGNYEA